MLNGRKVECGNGTFGVYTTPNLPNGPQTFTVNAVDKVGNKGSPKFVSWFLGKIFENEICSIISFDVIEIQRGLHKNREPSCHYIWRHKLEN